LQESLELLSEVRSYGGYRSVLQRYAAGFRDGHLSLNLNLDYRWTGWPRFLLAWRDGRVVVHHAERGAPGPAVGSTLVACDGQDAEALYNSRVMPFAGKGIPADRWRLTPEILLDRINPLLEQPKRCTFEQNGKTQEIDLSWTWTDWSSLREAHSKARLGPRGSFGSRPVDGNGLWLSLPTFGPRGDDLAQMKAIMAALPEHRQRDFVVVDVRNNGGGSSYWAEAFVRGLYGDGYYEALRDEMREGGYAIYRVSQQNVEHFRGLLGSIRAQAGEDSGFYRYFESLAEAMAAALERGETMYAHRPEEKEAEEEEEEEKEEKPSPEEAQPRFAGTVYLLTDTTCGSACLDFADVVRELPYFVHVGLPTSGDTLYMEVRTVRLPSNNGRLTFATKVYRERTRGHNEFYTPAHEWPGDIWRTEELETWIRSLHAQRADPDDDAG
ncbi:MAG: S41 family peptidase, partial [Acidobacteriota bacterium]